MSCLDKVAFLLPQEEIDQGTMGQICEIAKLDECERMAIMPDVHFGYAMPIGGVALMRGVISPSFVGYDIGCGICLLDTGLSVAEVFPDEDAKRNLFNDIYRAIPTGVGSAWTDPSDFRKVFFKSALGCKELDQKVNATIGTQLGTLGSGNHFIEIGVRESTGTVCITLHSGSRRPGWEVGNWYMRNYPLLLTFMSDEGAAYVRDMNFMLEYALENRRIMLGKVLALIPHRQQMLDKYPLFVNENHNHAMICKDGLVLHRKGATPADDGQYGVIPGSMESGVRLTVGLGNDAYLASASHGAGRVLGRNAAKKTLSMTEFEERMQGVVAAVSESTLDESPMAYKDLDTVMDRQEGLTVRCVDRILPLVNVKGQDGGHSR